ncbi:MAG: DUF3800 domain-containing protein [Candidatus Methanosuratincola petrocarbonis]
MSPAFQEKTSPLYVFVDEAGDLGFTNKATRFFVIAYVIPENHARTKTVIHRLKRSLKKKDKKLNEFKHSKDCEKVRNMVLERISGLSISIGAVVIDKNSVKKELRDKKSILYNYLVADKVATALLREGADKAVLVLDMCMSKEARDHFNTYFMRKLNWKERISSTHCSILNIMHKHSYEEPNLQIADYVAGAIFRKFERNLDDEYLKIRHLINYTDGWGVKW